MRSDSRASASGAIPASSPPEFSGRRYTNDFVRLNYRVSRELSLVLTLRRSPRSGRGSSAQSPATQARPRASVKLRIEMRVRVLFFGILKDIVGRSEEHLDLPENGHLGGI